MTDAAMQKVSFKYAPFSVRQKKVLTWWMNESPYKDCDGIICDGSIRSGKTISMSISFVMWAMYKFKNENFAICGKSIGAVRRNVILSLKNALSMRGYTVVDKRGDNVLVITYKGVTNMFYLFGATDERSQDLIQGFTLAGILFDEAAIMPESFINQATGRCSIDGSKHWFNCNPQGSGAHWFKQKWIDQYIAKNYLYLHFTMEDNLSLSENIKKRYKSMYSGVFYKRYIEGRWVAAEGLIYDMLDKEANSYTDGAFSQWEATMHRRYIAIDYGTTNPMVFLDARDDGKTFWIEKEYYYDSRSDKNKRQKTDEEYANDFEEFVGYDQNAIVILDPSAASFRIALRNRGYHVKDADNDVADGIRFTATMLLKRYIKIKEGKCNKLWEELMGYVWDDKAAMRGEEKPLKIRDHCLTGDTLVDTVKGPIPIKNLVGKIGFLWCYDEKNNKRRKSLFYHARLARLNVPVYEIETEEGHKFKATCDHPVLTDKGWKRVDELTSLFYIQTAWLTKEKIRNILFIGKEDVYDLSVVRYHNFSVGGGLIVHNCCDALRYLVKTLTTKRRLAL